MEYLDKAEEEKLVRAWTEGEGVGPRVSAGAFYQDGCGVSCACVTDSAGNHWKHGWMMWSDPASTGPPAYVIEGALLHALTLAEQRLASDESRN